jgi:hypothetical protein
MSHPASTTTIETGPTSAFTPVPTGGCKTNKCDTCQHIVHPKRIRHNSGVNTCDTCVRARKAEAPEPEAPPVKIKIEPKCKTKGKAKRSVKDPHVLSEHLQGVVARGDSVELPLALVVMHEVLASKLVVLQKARGAPEYNFLSVGQRGAWVRMMRDECDHIKWLCGSLRKTLGAHYSRVGAKLAKME